ncbi:MAG: hypothetical protein JW839_20390 [Candidatus Lokiarchaeota archaeon]|nr:hypothetical protein [Candidatus Lokiarchaeota archaeon]
MASPTPPDPAVAIAALLDAHGLPPSYLPACIDAWRDMIRCVRKKTGKALDRLARMVVFHVATSSDPYRAPSARRLGVSTRAYLACVEGLGLPARPANGDAARALAAECKRAAEELVGARQDEAWYAGVCRALAPHVRGRSARLKYGIACHVACLLLRPGHPLAASAGATGIAAGTLAKAVRDTCASMGVAWRGAETDLAGWRGWARGADGGGRGGRNREE